MTLLSKQYVLKIGGICPWEWKVLKYRQILKLMLVFWFCVLFWIFFLMNAYVRVIMPLCNETKQTQDLRGEQNKNEIFYSKYCTKFKMLHPSTNATFHRIKTLFCLSSAFSKV